MTDDAADVKSRQASHHQQHTRTEPMSDGAAERGDDARKMLHVTVKRPGRETTDQMRLEMVEDAASGRVAKDQVRLEMVEDAASGRVAKDQMRLEMVEDAASGRVAKDRIRLEMVEDAASGRVAKDQIRLEMVDDAPSPSSATDPQQPSPSPSLEYYDHLPKSDSISVSVQQYAFSFFGFHKLVFTLFQLTFQKNVKCR